MVTSAESALQVVHLRVLSICGCGVAGANLSVNRSSRSRMSLQEGLNLLHFVGREPNFGGGPDALDLFRASYSRNRSGDGRIGQRPGTRDHAGGDAAPRADLFEKISDSQVTGEQRLLVVLRLAAK